MTTAAPLSRVISPMPSVPPIVADEIAAFHPPAAEMLCATLKRHIDALSTLPPQISCCAYTHRRTHHVAFVNGYLKQEGLPAVSMGEKSREAVALLTFEAVVRYRDSIPGPHLLVWRCLPKFETVEGQERLYLRLAFDTDTEAERS